MLSEIGTRVKVNNLSPALRGKLDQRLAKMGRFVKYKFHISHRNPDPEKHGGERLLPATYTLQPVTYFIEDEGRKKVGLPKDQLDQFGDPTGFNNVMLRRQDKALITLDMKKSKDKDTFAYLEMHPGFKDGLFPDPETESIFERIDEARDAKRKTDSRKLRNDAMFVASNFSVKEDKDFAAAMGWDENMDAYLLRDKIETLAETDPAFFAEFLEKKSVPYRAIISRAEAAGIIIWNTEEYKYIWGSTRETIAAFGRQENLDRLGMFTDWLMTDKTGDAVYDKLKKMLAAQSRAVPTS